MHYVKHFNINNVDTKQVACIELHGKPNAATEGAVGVLGVDVDSPYHEVYKCVAVRGSIYTWELLSSGLSIISSTISGSATETVQFSYEDLRTPTLYIVKIGDLILDSEGNLYQVTLLNTTYCVGTYCGLNLVASTHKHTKSEIYDFPITMPPSFHYQSPDTILAGQFTKTISASRSITDGQEPSSYVLRNSTLSNTPNISPFNGEICWIYE